MAVCFDCISDWTDNKWCFFNQSLVTLTQQIHTFTKNKEYTF